MNTKAELQWWIEFAQKDLGRIKQKTKDRLEKELKGKMLDSSFLGSNIHDEYLGPNTLEAYQEGAAAFVGQLKNILKGNKGDSGSSERLRSAIDPSIKLDIDVKFTGILKESTDGTFHSYTIVEQEPYYQVFYYMIKLMEWTKREDFKNCEYCGKLFLQVSREKRFCTRNCAANSAKR